MKKSFILVIAFALLMSCDKNGNVFRKVSNPTKLKKIEFVRISKGNIYGYPKQMQKANLVISGNEAWENLIDQMNKVQDGIRKSFNEVNIDFEKYIILAVFDSVYHNGGHTIDITDVVENDGKVVVTVNILHPKGNLTSIMTQPYEIIKIPRTSEPVIFKKAKQKITNSFNATIIGKGLDCGSYLIKFDSTVQALPNDKMGYVYYEINLPDEYKIKGRRINVEFRKPKKDEFMVCTTFGPSYPQIFIVEVLGFEH